MKKPHNPSKLANTVFMKKPVFATLVAVFLCLSSFSSCLAPSNSPTTPNETFQNATTLPPKEILFPPLQTDETLVPTPTLSPFWDVSDVDISKLDPSKKHIAFTFDDAPNRTLEQLVGIFTEYNEQNPDCIANATVFFNGIGIHSRSIPSVQIAYAVGFEMGNHTFSHFNLCNLSKERLQKEIDETDRLLESIDGKKRHLLRAPYGNVNALVRECTHTPILNWSIDTLDWTNNSVDEICERVLSGLESGGIVLMHDGPQNTVHAVKRLLPTLKRLGYQVTSVSQLSKLHTCPLRIGGVYTRARKNRQ